MDYRKFLQRREALVLPYLGGATVDAPGGRRLRVTAAIDAGWWAFEVEGRQARPHEPAEPVDLAGLPRLRGHLTGAWLFTGGGQTERLQLLPPDQPPELSPCTARRWHGGEAIFEALEFEQDAEEQARQALEEGQGIGTVKGVAASLRAAFAFALLSQVARASEVPVSPWEVLTELRGVAEGAAPAARAVLVRLTERRQMDQHRLATWAGRRGGAAAANRNRYRQPEKTAEDRALEALRVADATLLSTRRLGDDQLEVVFRFLGERFVTLVDVLTLQVVDAGICLDGADRELTLDSLPAVIREAIELGELCITRR